MIKVLGIGVMALSFLAAPGFAQTKNTGNQGGLVNVAVGAGDVASNNDAIVQVPIGVAAQACGISAAVLAQQAAGDTACRLSQEQATAAGIGGGPGKGKGNGQTDNTANQAGLVNVAVGTGDVASNNDVIVQVPVGVAAQACGISAAVLAQQAAGDTACRLTQEQATAAGIGG